MILCPKTNQPSADMVFTPRPLAKEIIDHFAPSGKILDPSRGDGAFFDQFPGACVKKYCELSEGVDFFDHSNGLYDWIITNPPWSKIRAFTQKAMDISENVVYLATINHFFTRARLADIRREGFGIAEIYCVDTPSKPWPASGFQLGAVHLRRNHKGSTVFSYSATLDASDL
jgi:hypothetical protein